MFKKDRQTKKIRPANDDSPRRCFKCDSLMMLRQKNKLNVSTGKSIGMEWVWVCPSLMIGTGECLYADPYDGDVDESGTPVQIREEELKVSRAVQAAIVAVGNRRRMPYREECFESYGADIEWISLLDSFED